MTIEIERVPISELSEAERRLLEAGEDAELIPHDELRERLGLE